MILCALDVQSANAREAEKSAVLNHGAASVFSHIQRATEEVEEGHQNTRLLCTSSSVAATCVS